MRPVALGEGCEFGHCIPPDRDGLITPPLLPVYQTAVCSNQTIQLGESNEAVVTLVVVCLDRMPKMDDKDEKSEEKSRKIPARSEHMMMGRHRMEASTDCVLAVMTSGMAVEVMITCNGLELDDLRRCGNFELHRRECGVP